jgi:dolichol-phosphate mannosyltransferase
MHDPKGIHDLAARKPQQDAALAAPELTVVIPTFREVANIPLLVERLRETLAGIAWEAVFVDDDSPDGTAAEIRRLGADDARIRCIRRIGRRGLAGACIEGMLASQASYVAVMDADLQHDESVLVKMLEKLRTGDVDLAVASRYLDGKAEDGFSRARARISAKATALSAKLLGIRLSDPMSGFFMIRREVFENLAPKLSSQGFKILLDIVATAGGRLRTVELPYVFRKRMHGESKLDSQVALDYLALLLAKATDDVVSIRFLSFGVIGLSGIGIHMLALLFALQWFVLPFPDAQLAATLAAITSNYALNNAITYRDLRLRGLRFVRGWFEFTLICGIGAMSNIGIATWIYGQHVRWALAGLAGAVVGVAWNYMVTRMFVWKAS